MPQTDEKSLTKRERLSRRVLEISDCVDQLERNQHLLELALDGFPCEDSKDLKRIALLLEILDERNSNFLAELTENLIEVRRLLGHPVPCCGPKLGDCH